MGGDGVLAATMGGDIAAPGTGSRSLETTLFVGAAWTAEAIAGGVSDGAGNPPFRSARLTKVTRTRAVPWFLKPSRAAARSDKSMMRPLANGPRSFTRTISDLPLSRLVTRTFTGIGNVRWAAVSSLPSYISPSAV